eukprot:jgi/Mesvir1/16988/Mv19364-RA.1
MKTALGQIRARGGPSSITAAELTSALRQATRAIGKQKIQELRAFNDEDLIKHTNKMRKAYLEARDKYKLDNGMDWSIEMNTKVAKDLLSKSLIEEGIDPNGALDRWLVVKGDINRKEKGNHGGGVSEPGNAMKINLNMGGASGSGAGNGLDTAKEDPIESDSEEHASKQKRYARSGHTKKHRPASSTVKRKHRAKSAPSSGSSSRQRCSHSLGANAVLCA